MHKGVDDMIRSPIQNRFHLGNKLAGITDGGLHEKIFLAAEISVNGRFADAGLGCDLGHADLVIGPAAENLLGGIDDQVLADFPFSFLQPSKRILAGHACAYHNHSHFSTVG